MGEKNKQERGANVYEQKWYKFFSFQVNSSNKDMNGSAGLRVVFAK